MKLPERSRYVRGMIHWVGFKQIGVLPYSISETNRKGDHISYISDLRKIRSHFPAWKLDIYVPAIIEQVVKHHRHPAAKSDNPSPAVSCHA